MIDLPRRAVLGRTALATLAGATVPALGRSRPVGALPAEMRVVASRAALTALADAHPDLLVYLAAPGCEGVFRCVAAAEAPADDPLGGLTIVSRHSDLRFVRVWDGIHGNPEWFGAQPGDPAHDCADAIEACYAACPVTELGAGDYFVRRTLRFARSGRTLKGMGAFAEGQGRGTRIVLHRSAKGVSRDDVMLVGSSVPVSVPSDKAPSDCHFSHFTLVRDGDCTPHPSGDLARYPAGLRAAFAFHCTFRSIASLESSVGFYIGGVVYTKFDDCYALRVRPGTSAAKDYCVGYYLNGHVSFGYAGGNASLYLRRCLVSDQHPQHVDPTGLLARGAFVDTFLDEFESARVATGIACQTDGARGIGNTVDLHIRRPILDGCTRCGIDLDLGGTTSASVDLDDPYIYAASSGGQRGIAVHDGAGLVTLSGGQVHGDFAGGSLHLSRVRGVRVQGTKVHQASRPVLVESASALILEPQINNDSTPSPHFAVTCLALSRSIVRPIVIGANGPSFVGGIEFDATCEHMQVDGSAVDPACFHVPDARSKVRFSDGDARSGAAAQAFAARGNRLVGVTD